MTVGVALCGHPNGTSCVHEGFDINPGVATECHPDKLRYFLYECRQRFHHRSEPHSSYAHQPERLLALTDDGRISKEVRHFRCASITDSLLLEETTTSASLTEVFAVKASDYKFAVVLSDGIHSFFTTQQTATSKRVDDVPMEEILRELISFKSVRGAFVRRRLQTFLKVCHAKGWRHRDDLAIGALHLADWTENGVTRGQPVWAAA